MAGAIPSGPPGDFFMAIAGTSMSSPHAAGVSAFVKAAHPTWTPGQIKSALMTSSVQDVLKPDGVTPADPFNTGAGSIRATGDTPDADVRRHGGAIRGPRGGSAEPDPREHAEHQRADDVGAGHHDAVARNVSGESQKFTVHAEAPAGGSIRVNPASFTIASGQTKTLTITIDGEGLAADQQYFGSITLDAAKANANDVFLPVAFFKQQGGVRLTHFVLADDVPQGFERGVLRRGAELPTG